MELHEVRSQSVYDFLFDNKDSVIKKVRALVAYTIPFFPQFEDYEKKWEYILAIPKIPPKDYSITPFCWAVKSRIDNIPGNLKDTIVGHIESFLKKQDLSIGAYQFELDLIKEIKDN